MLIDRASARLFLLFVVFIGFGGLAIRTVFVFGIAVLAPRAMSKDLTVRKFQKLQG